MKSDMKNIIFKSKIKVFAALASFMMIGTACNEFLELEPLDKTSPTKLLATEKGLNTLIADLYNALPMEDFNYRPGNGFNSRGWGSGVGEMTTGSMFTDEAIRTDGGSGLGLGGSFWWGTAYSRNRVVSLFIRSVEQVRANGVISDAQAARLTSEAHFVRAYIYFGLVKRWGGVPIIDEVLDDYFVPGQVSPELYVPRSTENESWRFMLKECDLAIAALPDAVSSNDGIYRANKWAAYALKSRIALHAASVAKYWDRAPSSPGEAVNLKLVGGMTASDADFFYTECISASQAIIDNSGKTLYMPNPANPAEAAKNYQDLFMADNKPSISEYIFGRAYLDGTLVANQGTDYDIRYSPSQGHPGFHKFGRYSVALDIVDAFEDYTDDGTGKSAPIVTRTDGIENTFLDHPNALDINAPLKKYDNPYDAFKDKDARLLATVVVPGSKFKANDIVIQAGIIGKNGTIQVYVNGQEEGKDGKMYYCYGASTPGQYTGFAGMFNSDDANFTTTGFSIRKYLAENKTIASGERSSYNSWIDMRLAEVYLNYAEAVVESGKGDATRAAQYINALRKRAGHTDNISLTLDNVLKERRIELAFENSRVWDMARRREYHTYWTFGKRTALIPMIDLREDTPKTVFVRTYQYHDQTSGGRTFNPRDYYFSIPGISDNKLVQNPGH